jgi:hypothetical protein
VAGGTEASAFTGEGEQVLCITVVALNTGKSKMRIAAVEVFIYNIENMRTPVTIHALIDGIPDTFQLFVIISNKLVVSSVARRARPV